jgi:hypothetical protein
MSKTRSEPDDVMSSILLVVELLVSSDGRNDGLPIVTWASMELEIIIPIRAKTNFSVVFIIA